jgi:aryl-alcohol dehydrogenase-like predicted oxidoreductase
MEMRQLGETDLRVSRLGIGLSEIGSTLAMGQEEEAARVLNTALDMGINFLDTAACYGSSEELIGRTVSGRRHEYVLATKAGHVVGEQGGRSWMAETVRESIERSLRRLQTDHLDLVQLHSCGIDVLERGDVIRALTDAKDAGKVRYIGYSGDNEAARWAVESGVFDTLQTSFNLVDQRARLELFPLAEAKGMGIIAKRPIANAAWGASKSPSVYAREYFQRAREMEEQGALPETPDNRILLALGFTLAHEEVDTAIAGTSDPEHVRGNVAMVEDGLPISNDAVEELHRRFEELGRGWMQQT